MMENRHTHFDLLDQVAGIEEAREVRRILNAEAAPMIRHSIHTDEPAANSGERAILWCRAIGYSALIVAALLVLA